MPEPAFVAPQRAESPVIKPVVESVVTPPPAPKPEIPKSPEVRAREQVQRNIGFRKLSAEEVHTSLVTLNNDAAPISPRGSHLKQVVTKKDSPSNKDNEQRDFQFEEKDKSTS
jgi:hypothetical protein